MKERQVIQALVATFIVASLVTVSLAMLIVWPAENWPDGDLPTFESESQMRDYLNGNRQDSGYDWSWLWFWNHGFSGETSSDGLYYTETNVQVNGVDELDMVKTDGECLFVSHPGGVSIVRTSLNGSLQSMSEVSMADIYGVDRYGSVKGMFVHGDVLAVVAYEFDSFYDSYGESFYYGNDPVVICHLINVSDPASPKGITSLSMSGYFTGARMIGDHMYLLTEEYAWNGDVIVPPQVGVDGESEEMAATSIRFDPGSESANTFLNILALNLDTHESNFTSIVTESSSVMYVSTENLYLTYVKHNYGYWGLEDSDATSTTIFRLSLNGLDVVPQAKGQVKGFPLNQFAMDEMDGILRMAVCTASSDQESGVYALDQDLNVIGSLTGIAPGETITSVRFDGSMLYLVTFLQTDPLFMIDITDPNEPTLLGELTVPGFSTYLHPCGDGLLAGIGVENWDLKVSLFDVSSPVSPAEVNTIRFSIGTTSEAIWEHKAVCYDQMRRQLMIPVTTATIWNETHYDHMDQVLVIQVDETGLTVIQKLQIDPGDGSVRCVVIDSVLYTVTVSSVTAWEVGSYDKLCEIFIGSE